jgi:putative hemolysin
MTNEQILHLTALLGLLVLSGFFSGSETALLSINRFRLKYLVNKKKPGAKHLEEILNPPDRLLSAILVGNNLVNIAVSVFATTFFVNIYGEQGEIMTIVILTPILLLFAEIFPKTLAAQKSEKMSFLVLRPIRFVMWILTPVVSLLTFITGLLTRLVGLRESAAMISEEEIRTMITVGEQAGVVAREKRRMLHGIFELSKTRVRDVMVPRTEVVGIEINTPFAELVSLLQEGQHSRYPVFEEHLDNVFGVIHAKDVLGYIGRPQDFSLRDIAREPYFVPESKLVETLLQSFKEKRLHLAVVVDEYGGLEGIVTLEDIFEEIVGEIQDEYDVEEVLLFRELSPGRYVIDGSVSIRTINRKFGLKLSGKHVTTLAGLLLHTMGAIPKKGDSCRVDGTVFKVRKVVDRRIEEIEMILPMKQD